MTLREARQLLQLCPKDALLVVEVAPGEFREVVDFQRVERSGGGSNAVLLVYEDAGDQTETRPEPRPSQKNTTPERDNGLPEPGSSKPKRRRNKPKKDG